MKGNMRKIDAEIIENCSAEKRRRNEAISEFIFILQKKLELVVACDRKICLETLKLIAQLEEEAGDELVEVFSSYLKDRVIYYIIYYGF